MIVALAADSGGMDGKVPALFSESRRILIVESDTGEVLRSIERGDRSDADLARELAALDCEALLCGPIEREAFLIIADAGGITRYNAAGFTVREALAGFSDRALELLRDFIGGSGCKSRGSG